MGAKELFIHKKELVDRIYSIAQKQAECIKNDDLEEFQTLIYSREELIVQLTCTNSQIIGFDLSDEMKVTNEQINKIIKVICALDNENQRLLKNMQTNIDYEFKKMNTAKKVITKGYMNYAGAEQQPAYYLDKKN